MENLELSLKEKKELEKRWFFVKEIFAIPQFLRNVIPYIGLLSLLYFLFLDNQINIWVTLFLWALPLYYFGLFCKNYILLWKLFITSSSKLLTLRNDYTFEDFQNDYILLNQLNKWFNKDTRRHRFYDEKDDWWTPIFKKIVLVSIILWTFIYLIKWTDFYIWISNIFLLYFTPTLFIYILRQGIEKFHPLYAFWNIGMKIQKLTPEIESQSKLIQAGFQEDLNFSILHSGFEKLSVILSQIGELVLKLEKIEKRANKGNIFDSVKYIDSLRSDIVVPLVELKVFLERRRSELIQSQQELIQVMVGKPSEPQESMELVNKRGEMLLEELDTNIEKLGEMIEKMG